MNFNCPTASPLRSAPRPVRTAPTGYRGRLAMHELMVMTEDLGQLAVRNASSEEMRYVAMLQGMRTLRQDGSKSPKA